MKKFIENIVIGISIILLVWIGLSYGEILCENLKPNPQYSKYNAIVNIVEWAENK
jgi:hypothetical protein